MDGHCFGRLAWDTKEWGPCNLHFTSEIKTWRFTGGLWLHRARGPFKTIWIPRGAVLEQEPLTLMFPAWMEDFRLSEFCKDKVVFFIARGGR